MVKPMIEEHQPLERGQALATNYVRRYYLYFTASIILLALALLLGISLGSINISPTIVLRIIFQKFLPGSLFEISSETSRSLDIDNVVIWSIRAPRVAVAALVGAGLSIAGAQMQGLFKNPLASPDIVGTSSGGAFGAVLAIALGFATRSLFYLPIFAFIGAVVSLFVVYTIATQRGRTPVATLLLAGVVCTALIGAASSFVITLKFVSYQVAQEILFWLLGGLDSRSWIHVWMVLPGTAIGLLISLIFSRDLDLMLLGEESAASLGVEVEQVKRIIITEVALITGAAVAVSGVVGFVGLVIPHIVRILIGPSHTRLILGSAITGASFLVLADLVARTLIRPEEIRLGIITAAFGAPFFLYLLMRHRREALTL
ncbi:MAG: FecCD family ABC transporter permease [Pyrinomonadaceae bacterium]